MQRKNIFISFYIPFSLKKIYIISKFEEKKCVLACILQIKIISRILRFYNMFVKIQRVLANILKILKPYFWEFIIHCWYLDK